MKKNKIFLKLFFMTFFSVMILIILQFCFQYFWMEDFYIKSKENALSVDIESIKKSIEDGQEKDYLENAIFEKEMASNFKLGVYDRFGNPYYGVDEIPVVYVEVVDDSGKTYEVTMTDKWNDSDVINVLKVGESISLEGNLTATTVTPAGDIAVTGIEGVTALELTPAKVDISGNIYQNSIATIDFSEIKFSEASFTEASKSVNIVNGQITSVDISRPDSTGSQYRENKLFEAQMLFFNGQKDLKETLKINKNVSYIKTDEYTGIKNMVVINSFKDKSGNDLFLFAVASLQPIEEATGIMQRYFIITFFIAAIVASIMSYFYSRHFSKPLIHLNEVTSRIAHVDFSEKCRVNTHDEIEDLAININNMSDQLEATLNQLKYFLADASHELKTPLTVVKGIVEGLIDGVYESGDVENYNKIIAEVNDMSGLVYDLLEISKMETGQVEISSDIFLLSDIVLDVNDKLQPLIKKKNIEVKLFLTDFFVEGDEERIKKVVRNLYTNAIKYTKSDGEILISTLDSDGKGCFEIKNSPARISDEDLNNLWKPFYRAEKSRNKSLGGSGLGLYMVKEILERHGAEYGIENFEDGVKAYFYISLKSSNIYINS